MCGECAYVCRCTRSGIVAPERLRLNTRKKNGSRAEHVSVPSRRGAGAEELLFIGTRNSACRHCVRSRAYPDCLMRSLVPCFRENERRPVFVHVPLLYRSLVSISKQASTLSVQSSTFFFCFRLTLTLDTCWYIYIMQDFEECMYFRKLYFLRVFVSTFAGLGFFLFSFLCRFSGRKAGTDTTGPKPTCGPWASFCTRCSRATSRSRRSS